MNFWMYSTALFCSTSLALPLVYRELREVRRRFLARDAEFFQRQHEWTHKLGELQSAHDELVVRHTTLRERVQTGGMIESIFQPVILVGPKGVGKTSLLSHWRAPWLQVRPVQGTMYHSQADVPVCDVPTTREKAHFADADLMVKASTRLMLRVHDFPGEITAQEEVKQVLLAETRHLREHSKRNLGVVIVCMFDAGEVEHGVTHETRRYYNQELFKHLGALVRADKAEIERLILVFNKVDRLRHARSGAVPDSDLLGECESVFVNMFEGLSELCHPGRIIPVLTMLDRENNRVQSRGAPLILGEAARPMVESVMGDKFANRVLTDRLRPVSAAHVAQAASRKIRPNDRGDHEP
jgi:hypothetical protein